ncbi:hypothetical protein CQW23_28573 [Capsicum baccatum]|uniref:D-isomer specific 2-hydroxyacid dehydrogenase catalytic domain-containing protein n=1 Tax=Capsicum baccatum TaxID=33114 RepID=A0A2G2VGX3_CAPBA|nr:hypothetical protein CQW23_28573 [Capsicum baccatum]
MEKIGVLLTCPMSSYLEQQLNNRFSLFKYWESSSKSQFSTHNSDSIRAVVGNAFVGADSDLINALPNLEIVSSYSVGLDKIDLAKCKERGIRVTNTPDVLTDDVADTAIGLTLATLRRICVADGFVRHGLWKNGDFELTTKDSKDKTTVFLLAREITIQNHLSGMEDGAGKTALMTSWPNLTIIL